MTFEFVDAIVNMMSYQPGGHCEVLRNLTTIRTRAELQFSKEKKEKRKRNRTRRNHHQLFALWGWFLVCLVHSIYSSCSFCCCFLSASHRWIFSFSSVFGRIWSMVRGLRLKGSVWSLSRCLAMVDLSTVTLEDGSTTGSDISVLMMGSRNSSQASA